MEIGGILGLAIGLPVVLLIGAAVGYFFAMRVFKRQMKKNPPINEAQIKAMYQQMGRTPSQAQIKQVMARMKGQNDQ